MNEVLYEKLKLKQPNIAQIIETGRFQSKFEMISVLGEGGFGKVYKVKYLADHNIYALKLVKLHLGLDENLMEHRVYREIQAITKM